MITGPILTATDLSDEADEALRQADACATPLDAELIVCHSLPELLRVRMLFPQLADADREAQLELEDKAREAVEWQVERVTGRPPDQVTIAIDSGSPHAVILTKGEEVNAGLIVLGPGPTADRVVRYAHCPVLVARPSPPGVVLGATDFSDPALPAVQMAAAEASRRRVPLRLLHAIGMNLPAPGVAPVGVPLFEPHTLDELQHHAEARLREALQRTGVAGDPVVAAGPAGQAIIEDARRAGAELIVVGTRGRSGLARLALGSTAEAVLHSAPCSVLVVRLHAQ